MTKTARQVLVDALALIEDESHWTKHAYSMPNAAGEPQYCALGALRKATFGDLFFSFLDPRTQTYWLAVAALQHQVDKDLTQSQFARSIVDWNDSTYHGDVVAKFRAAIERATRIEEALAKLDPELVA